jgi:hypothetical protein
MSKQQDFFEWQDDYVAAEWVETKVEAEVIADPEEIEETASHQTYLSTYHKDLHQRKSVDSLNKITQVVFAFGGLVVSTFVLGWFYYHSSLTTAQNPFSRKANVPSQTIDNTLPLKADQSLSEVCEEVGESCNSPTATDLNQVTETINRYREKREEYYNQIEELD